MGPSPAARGAFFSRRRLAACTVGCALACAMRAAAAVTAVFTPVQDTTLYSDNDHYSSGAGSFVFIGSIASGAPRRTLLRFDLSSIPPGASISSVSLRLTVSRAAPGTGLNDPGSLHRLLAAWGEGGSNGDPGGAGAQATAGDATWAYRVYGNPAGGVPRVPWSVPGGDFVNAASAAIVINGIGSFNFGSTPGLVADVQAWVNDPSRNFGWLVRGDEVDSQTAKRLFGRGAFSSTDRPALTVEYSLPTPVADGDVPLPAWAIVALGGVLAAAMARVGRGAAGRPGRDGS